MKPKVYRRKKTGGMWFWEDGKHYVLISKITRCDKKGESPRVCGECSEEKADGLCVICNCPDHAHFMRSLPNLCIGKKGWYEEWK